MQKILSQVSAKVSRSSQPLSAFQQMVRTQPAIRSYRQTTKLTKPISLGYPIQESLQEGLNLELDIGQKPKIATSQIHASPRVDPGCREIFGCLREDFDKQKHEMMENVDIYPNNGQIANHCDDYLATDHLIDISCSYKIDSHKRSYVLLMVDMQYGYQDYIKQCIPPVKNLLNEFREQELPVLWTNYARVPGDGLLTAQDRYYGPQGVDDGYNPSFVYGPKGATTMTELAPINDQEMSRTIQSLHLSKFADLDAEGREILFPMLEAWGVNTIVLCGAWTDACIAATAYDAVDKYGYDVIMVRDGVASGTVHGEQMKSALYSAQCCEMTSKQIVNHLQAHPELTEEPNAPLWGHVYKTHQTNYRQDYHAQRVEELKNKIAELESKLVSRS